MGNRTSKPPKPPVVERAISSPHQYKVHYYGSIPGLPGFANTIGATVEVTNKHPDSASGADIYTATLQALPENLRHLPERWQLCFKTSKGSSLTVVQPEALYRRGMWLYVARKY